MTATHEPHEQVEFSDTPEGREALEKWLELLDTYEFNGPEWD